MSIKFQNTKTILLVSTLVMVNLAFAGDRDDDAGQVNAPIKRGCYTVKRANLTESSVDAKNVVGNYKIVLAAANGPAYVISGPLSGAETGSDSGGDTIKSAQVKAAEETGPHGGHNFGTDKHVGTFSSAGDSIQVTSVSCPSGDGSPQFIKGIETLNFVKGTGVFTNLLSGQIQLNLTYDACNNKNNPVASLELISGQMCFK
jgi:hypothetical protein